MTQPESGGGANGSTALQAEPSTRFVGNYARAVPAPPQAAHPARPPVARSRRRARVQLRRVDPGSALRQAAVWSGVGFAVWLVAVTVLYGVLAALGVIGTVNTLFGQVTSAPGHGGGALMSLGGVWRVTALSGGVVALLAIVLASLTVAIYNLCARLVGGLEITFSER